jgi:serine/threonine protein kinase
MKEPLQHDHEQEVVVAAKNNGGAMQTRMCLTCQHTFDGELSHCPSDATPLVSIEDDPLIGKLFGKYRIISLIGQGGMGVVYKAEQIIQQRLVALKMIRSGVKDGGVLLRFQKEAKAVSALSHPNIVTVYDFAVNEDGIPYLAMEYIDGKSLADSDVKLSLGQAVDLFIQLCDALGHAHEKGVVHRDLKPGNIVSSDWSEHDGRLVAKILDFGIAKLLPSSGKDFVELTRTGQPIGSPSYMSPEQCRAEDLDARSDIYSLGCVMYRVLSGKPMFDEESIFNVINQHLKEIPPPFSQVCPEARIPLELEEIVFQAIEKDKKRRFQSMAELRQALERFKLGHSSTLQLLSTRMKRVVRYRRKAYVYLAWMLFGVVIFCSGIFAPQYLEQKALNIQADLKKLNNLIARASENLSRGENRSAELLLDEALRLEKPLPNSADCNLMRARTLSAFNCLYLGTSNYVQAESIGEQAYKLYVDSKAGNSYIALALVDWAEAKKCLRKFDEALKLLEQAKILAKDTPDELALCLAREGTVKENQRDFAAAEKAYREAARLFASANAEKTSGARLAYQGLERIRTNSNDPVEAAKWGAKARLCQ